MFEQYNYDGETDLWCNVSIEQIPVGVTSYISFLPKIEYMLCL